MCFHQVFLSVNIEILEKVLDKSCQLIETSSVNVVLLKIFARKCVASYKIKSSFKRSSNPGGDKV